MIRYIDKYGNPDAIFFSFEKNSYYAIWGFNEIFTVTKERINDSNILCELQNKINQWKSKTNENEIASVGFLSYDSKNIFFPKIKFNPIKSKGPVLWFGNPSIVKKVGKDDINGLIGITTLIDNTDKVITDKHLIKITDILGKETKGAKNEVLFYLYDDGTVEKRIVIE